MVGADGPGNFWKLTLLDWLKQPPFRPLFDEFYVLIWMENTEKNCIWIVLIHEWRGTTKQPIETMKLWLINRIRENIYTFYNNKQVSVKNSILQFLTVFHNSLNKYSENITRVERHKHYKWIINSKRAKS